MKKFRQVCKNGHLANSSASCSKIVHEQCSPELQKRSFGEYSSASCSRIDCRTVRQYVRQFSGYKIGKLPYPLIITVRHRTVRYTINDLNIFMANLRYGTEQVPYRTSRFVYGITSIEEGYSEKTARSDSLGE